MYLLDLEFGFVLYENLQLRKGFSLRMAADDGVWRYLAVAIVPDLVADRWGENNDDHYWKKPGRNWLRQIWWYIHLSWTGDANETRKVLLNNSTDEILNLVERAGRGYNLEVCRCLMKYYSGVPLNIRQKMKIGRSRTLFRTIMVMHTTYAQTVEPGLFEDKEEGYVRWLFKNAGVQTET